MKAQGTILFSAAILAGVALAGCSKSERLLAPELTPQGFAGSAMGAAPLDSHKDDDEGRRQWYAWSTNPWFPLIPGTEYRYRSETPDGVETQTVTVTDEIERIQGVRTVVVKDVVKLDGEVIERTRDYFAMDGDGNVWYFGEDTKSTDPETGETSTEGSWRSGRDGAERGIIMLAHPHVDDEYNEENAPGVAEDMARVVALHADAKVPAGDFDDALKTLNFTPLEPGVTENKYYVPKLGLVLEVDNEDGVRNELVSVTRNRDLARRGGGDDDDEHGGWWKNFGKRRR
jgi:hypothetical protein